jgi:hypothetical protein
MSEEITHMKEYYDNENRTLKADVLYVGKWPILHKRIFKGHDKCFNSLFRKARGRSVYKIK